MNDFIGASLSELGKKLSVRTHVYESMDVEQPFRGIEYTREGDAVVSHNDAALTVLHSVVFYD